MRRDKKQLKAVPVNAFSPHQTPESLMSHDEHDEDSHQSKDQFGRKTMYYRDEHAAKIFYQGQLAFAKVIRHKAFAPIYKEKEPLVTEKEKAFRLVIETYKMPIWVTYYYHDKKRNIEWPRALCEGIAFWLHRMERRLKAVLMPLTLIQFEIEVVVDPSFFDREHSLEFVDPSMVKIGVKLEVPRIQVYVPLQFLSLVRLNDNTADKQLMKAVLEGINDYVKAASRNGLFESEDIELIIREILQPKQAKMFLLTDPTQDMRLDTRGLVSERHIHEADTAYVLDNLVSYLPKGYHIPEVIQKPAEKRRVCKDVVLGLLNQIEQKLRAFNGAELLELLIKMNEKIVQVRKRQDILLPPRIACYSSFETELEKLVETDSQQVAAGQVLRTLIEFVAVDLPSGSRWANYDETEELMALTHEVIHWGTQSDAIWKLKENPPMGLLPSGRIGLGKTLQETLFAPYQYAKASESLYETVENFDSNYYSQTLKKEQTVQEEPPSVSADESEERELNNALVAETGFLLTELTNFVVLLSYVGFDKAESCIKMKQQEILDLARKELPEIPNYVVVKMLEYLTLLPRTRIHEPHPDHPLDEIYPWRHKRALSYLRRPLAKIDTTEGLTYYFGYRHLRAYLENLYFLLHNGKYPRAKSKQLTTWLGTVSSKKGNPFRTLAMHWFAAQPSLITIPEEIDITRKGPLVAERDYGDVDLLVADIQKKIIYSIECKNIAGAKTIYEMWSEVENYIGESDNDDDAKIIKHKKRHEWLQKNQAQLSKYIPGAENYQLKSLVLTPEEIPLSYLKGKDLPLPILSFISLRRNSVTVLDNL